MHTLYSSCFRKEPVLLLLILLLALLQCSITEEAVVLEQSQVQTTGNINKIYMFNNLDGIAIGGTTWEKGFVLTTKDGGATWLGDSISDKALLGLDYNGQDLISVGIDGYYFRSVNTAENWKFYRLPFWDVLRDAVIDSENSVIAVGGIAFHKGVIYHIKNDNEMDTLIQYNHELRSIAAINDQRYIAVGFGAIYLTNDRGYNWQLLPVNGDFYQSVCFADQENGMIVGEAGSILRTIDGGNTWQDLRDGNDIFQATGAFRDILMINLSEAYIVGDNGLIWKSSDNGESWTKLNNETREHYQTISYTNSHIIVGGENGKICRFLR